MGERAAFRAGDTVKHGPSGETWTLAIDERNGHVYWCGWPPDGSGKASDCTLVEATTDEARVEILRQVARARGDHGEVYRIAGVAMDTLHAERLCGDGCALCASERAAALAFAERAVLAAARAWREADLICRRGHGSPGAMDEVNRVLRAATDALVKLEEGNG